jgi:hypothetical protein
LILSKPKKTARNTRKGLRPALLTSKTCQSSRGTSCHFAHLIRRRHLGGRRLFVY